VSCDLSLDEYLGSHGLAQDLYVTQVLGDRIERAPEDRSVLLDPCVPLGTERCLDVGLGVDPSSERLLGQADLGKGTRARRQFVGLLEFLKGLVVLALAA